MANPWQSPDVFSDFDPVLSMADIDEPPCWVKGSYNPDLPTLDALLKLTVGTAQRSGRVAAAFDAWVAHELRRAGFDADAVWPRLRRPRVLPSDLSSLETAIDELAAASEELEANGADALPPRLKRAVRGVTNQPMGTSQAYILGDFYAKQVDVVISSWRRGPELLVSTKTQFSSYRNNFKNRHEEAVGEVDTLRRRHPMAAMGFAFMVRSNIYEGKGDYDLLRNILTRLRRPGETFDATMLLVADWDDADPAGTVKPIKDEDRELGPARFFEDLISAAIERTPVGEREAVRHRRDGEDVKGGSAEPGAVDYSDDDAPQNPDEVDDIP